MIRRCTDADAATIYEIVNDAAAAYKDAIPADRWHEPYMPMKELLHEIADGVEFWGIEEHGRLLGIMGIQNKGNVELIRHAYVRRDCQRGGVGSQLLRHLESLASRPILIGTWADAAWAVAFYRRNGYRLLPEAEKNQLLRTYWSIPERQVETSVVLASPRWPRSAPDAGGED